MFSKPVPPGRPRPEPEMRYCLLPVVEMPASTTVSSLARSAITPNSRPALPAPGGSRQPEQGAPSSPAPPASLRTHLNVQIHVSSQQPPRGQTRRASSPDARRRRRAPLPGALPPAAHAANAPATPPAAPHFRPPPAHSGPHFNAPPAHAASYRAGVQVRFPRPAAPPPAHSQVRGPPGYAQPVTPSPVMSVVLSGPSQSYPACYYTQPSYGYQRPRETLAGNYAYVDPPPPYAAPAGDSYHTVNQPSSQTQYVSPQSYYAAGMQYATYPYNNGQSFGTSQNVTYSYGVPMVGTWPSGYYTTYYTQNGPYTSYIGGPSWQNFMSLTNTSSGAAPSYVQQGNSSVTSNVALPGAPGGYQYHGEPSSQQSSAQNPLPPSQSGTANFDSVPYLNPGNTFHPQEPICTCSYFTVNDHLQPGVDHYFFPPVSNPGCTGITVNEENVTVNDVNCYMAQDMPNQLEDPYKYICGYGEQGESGEYGRSFDLEQHLDNFCNNLQCYHMFQARNASAGYDIPEQQRGENLTSSTSSEQSLASAIDDELTGRIVNDALDVLNDPPENEVSSSGIDLAE